MNPQTLWRGEGIDSHQARRQHSRRSQASASPQAKSLAAWCRSLRKKIRTKQYPRGRRTSPLRRVSTMSSQSRQQVDRTLCRYREPRLFSFWPFAGRVSPFPLERTFTHWSKVTDSAPNPMPYPMKPLMVGRGKCMWRLAKCSPIPAGALIALPALAYVLSSSCLCRVKDVHRDERQDSKYV